MGHTKTLCKPGQDPIVVPLTDEEEADLERRRAEYERGLVLARNREKVEEALLAEKAAELGLEI